MLEDNARLALYPQTAFEHYTRAPVSSFTYDITRTIMSASQGKGKQSSGSIGTSCASSGSDRSFASNNSRCCISNICCNSGGSIASIAGNIVSSSESNSSASTSRRTRRCGSTRYRGRSWGAEANCSAMVSCRWLASEAVPLQTLLPARGVVSVYFLN